MGTLDDWTTVDANNNAAPPDGWPENTMQYSDVNNTGRAVQGTLRRFWGDVNGALQAAGVADAYTVTLNETGYTAYFQGMYFAAEIPAQNTGASTIDVNGIGVQSITDRGGNPLTGGELRAGGIYEFRYDGTNFQLMGSIVGAVQTNQAVLTNANDPDLVDTDVSLVTGGLGSAPHIEYGPTAIQAKANATTAAALSLQALGGNLRIGAQSGTGTVTAYRNGVINFAAGDSAFRAFSPSNGDPTVPDNLAVSVSLRSQDDNEYGYIDFGSGDPGDMIVRNLARGAALGFLVEQTGGGSVNVFGANESQVDIYDPNQDTPRLSALGSGLAALLSDGNTTAEARMLQFQFSSGTVVGQIGHNSSDDLEIRNSIDSGRIELRADNSVGTNRLLFRGDPDGEANLYQEGTSVARTETAANGGLEVNNQSTGAGFERVLTTSDLGGGGPLHDEQTSDTTVNNSTVLVNSQISFVDIPIGFYKIEGLILLRDVAVSGCGARLDWAISGYDPDSVQRVSNKNFSGAGALSYDEQGLATDLFDNIGLVTGSGTSRMFLSGLVEVILASNSLTLQFAQHVATAQDLDFEAGSWVSLVPLS